MPLVGSREFSGALTFERPAGLPLRDDELALCQSVAALAGRILAIKQQGERGLLRHLRDAGRRQLERMLGARHMKRKLALLLTLAAALFFSIARADYRISAPATLEGAIRRTVAAPFDGFVADAKARAGDTVRVNQALALLDDRDLRLERLKWASQDAQYGRQQQEAVANRDRAKVQIVQALVDQSRAQVRLLDEQLARAVRRGDVLFEITPLDQYRLIIEIDERDIAELALGQRGRLLLSAIDDEPLGFAVSSITSVTTAREGRNYFRVEALMDAAGERLRPGMEGVAKVEIEERLLIWIWTHRLLNWARLLAWDCLP